MCECVLGEPRPGYRNCQPKKRKTVFKIDAPLDHASLDWRDVQKISVNIRIELPVMPWIFTHKVRPMRNRRCVVREKGVEPLVVRILSPLCLPFHHSRVVPERGVEPLSFWDWFLRPARMPIPPPRQK